MLDYCLNFKMNLLIVQVHSFQKNWVRSFDFEGNEDMQKFDTDKGKVQNNNEMKNETSLGGLPPTSEIQLLLGQKNAISATL